MNNLVLVLSKLSGKILCISFRDHAGHLDRIVVYTHKSLVVKRRPDLKDNRIAAIWLEIGLPHKRKILVFNGYREWKYLRQSDTTSSTVVAAQFR